MQVIDLHAFFLERILDINDDKQSSESEICHLRMNYTPSSEGV